MFQLLLLFTMESSWDQYCKPTINTHQGYLKNGNRFLALKSDGFMCMIDDIANATLFSIEEYISVVDMRRSLTLKVDDKEVYVDYAKFQDNVKYSLVEDSSDIDNYTLNSMYIKDTSDSSSIQTVSLIFPDKVESYTLALDNYGDGTLKWWSTTKVDGPVEVKPNQVFELIYK